MNANSRGRNNDDVMNLILHHQLQLQMNDVRNQALFGRMERDNHGRNSNHYIFNQFRVMQLGNEWDPRGSSDENSIDSMNYEQLLNAFGDGTENMGAEEGEIRRLPTHIVGDNQLPEDARQCLICLEDFEKDDSRTILPCLHGFHQKCCLKWLKTNGKCPICKHPISSNS